MPQCRMYMATTDGLLASARRLMEAGEITLEDYATMLRRSKEQQLI